MFHSRRTRSLRRAPFLNEATLERFEFQFKQMTREIFVTKSLDRHNRPAGAGKKIRDSYDGKCSNVAVAPADAPTTMV